MMGFRTVQQHDRMFDRGRQPPDSDEPTDFRPIRRVGDGHFVGAQELVRHLADQSCRAAPQDG